MDNLFLKALNDISFGDIRDGIFKELSKLMTADEFANLWISNYGIFDTYFIYENYVDNEWSTFKIEYSKNENDELVIDIASKQKVELKEEYVPVSEMTKATNAIQELLDGANIEVANAKQTIETINEELKLIKCDNEKLKGFESELNEIKRNERLEAAKIAFATDFESFNSLETFETDEVQNLVEETLDSEKALNATLKIKEILLECAKNYKAEESKKGHTEGVVEASKGLNCSFKTSKSYVETYGFDING